MTSGRRLFFLGKLGKQANASVGLSVGFCRWLPENTKSHQSFGAVWRLRPSASLIKKTVFLPQSLLVKKLRNPHKWHYAFNEVNGPRQWHASLDPKQIARPKAD